MFKSSQKISNPPKTSVGAREKARRAVHPWIAYK
jgi:hypothetical protein